MVSEKDVELGSSKTHFSNQEMQRWKVKRPQKTKTLGNGEMIEFGLCNCGPSVFFSCFF